MPNSPSDTNHKAREKNILVRALILSILLHGGIFVKCVMPEEAMAAVRDKITTSVRGFMRSAQKKAYIERLKTSAEEQAEPDGFFLDSEFFESGISEDELNEAGEKLAGSIREFQKLASKEKDARKVLRQLGKKQRAIKPDDHSSYLSRLLLKGKGNCEAKVKFLVSIIKKVYPDMPVKYQFIRKSNQNHIRVIVEIEGQWFALEDDGLVPVDQDDLRGTAIADTSIFVDSYLGRKTSVKLIGVSGNPKPIDNIVTDSYFSLVSADLSARLRDPEADKGDQKELEVSLLSEKEMDERIKLADKIRIDKQNEVLNACIKNEEVLDRIKEAVNRRYRLMKINQNPDKTFSLGFIYKRDDGNLEAETCIRVNEDDFTCGFGPASLFQILK